MANEFKVRKGLIFEGNTFIPPSRTTAERDELSPSVGWCIYNETDEEYSSYNGTWWTNSPITKNFTTATSEATIEAFIATLVGKIFKYDVTMNFADGDYSSMAITVPDIRTTTGNKIIISGADTRDFLGYGFFHNQTTDSDVTATLTTLSISGAVLTVATDSNYDFTGITGDIDLFGWTGAAFANEKMTISSTTASTITFTGSPSSITTMNVEGCGFYLVSSTNMAKISWALKAPSANVKFEQAAIGVQNGTDVATKDASSLEIEQCNIKTITDPGVFQSFGNNLKITKCTKTGSSVAIQLTSTKNVEIDLLSQHDSDAINMILINFGRMFLTRYKSIQTGSFRMSESGLLKITDAKIFVNDNWGGQSEQFCKIFLQNSHIKNIGAQSTNRGWSAEELSRVFADATTIENFDIGLYGNNVAQLYERNMTYTTVNTATSPSAGTRGNNLSDIG